MTYLSVRKRNTATVVSILLLVAAAACGVISGLGFGFKSLWQILMMACLVALIQISQRYLLSGYEYILDPLDEILTHNRLTVIRTVGKRRTSVFTMPLASLTAVMPYVSLKALIEEKGRPAQRMDFCPDLFPPESYWLLFEAYGEMTAVRLQCDAAFADELKKREML